MKLFGDLGTGKSTLAAQLALETIERSTTAVAVVIPVKTLHIAGQFTQRDLFNSLDSYVKDEIWIGKPEFKLESILNQHIEVLLILDGLDELARDLAGRLLVQAATLVENWPTIQIVTTSRPVEMLGVLYADWQIVHTVTLDDSAKLDFLRQELLADGMPTEHINDKSAGLLYLLKEAPALERLEDTLPEAWKALGS